MHVTLITVVGGNTDTFPHMLEHYRSLGVEEFIIHTLAPTCQDEQLSRISRIAADFGIRVASTNTGPWAVNMSEVLYTIPRASKPNEWFILADSDELQVYPDGLFSALQYCGLHGYDYIEGCLVDRIAEDGRLACIQSAQSVWVRCPLGAMISGRLLGAVTNKIVAAKGYVRTMVGQHIAFSGRGCPADELYVPVHHFKWTEGLLERLNERVALRETIVIGNRYAEECKSFIAHYRLNGRINIDDPRLLVGRCNPCYPHWDKLLEWRRMAPCFSPQLARIIS